MRGTRTTTRTKHNRFNRYVRDRAAVPLEKHQRSRQRQGKSIGLLALLAMLCLAHLIAVGESSPRYVTIRATADATDAADVADWGGWSFRAEVLPWHEDLIDILTGALEIIDTDKDESDSADSPDDGADAGDDGGVGDGEDAESSSGNATNADFDTAVEDIGIAVDELEQREASDVTRQVYDETEWTANDLYDFTLDLIDLLYELADEET